MSEGASQPKPTACILCECNCGIRVKVGGDNGRRMERILPDKAHPGSEGYLCNKASRLDYYQNRSDRLLSPMRRTADGGYEAVDWDTAITEVAARLKEVRDVHGGDKILYYGGGGQGNHLPGVFSSSTTKALGVRYRSNALAQEKTGEFWVNQRMFGNGVRGDFERCEVGLFIGKNPWHSHGIPRARITLREMAKDPERCLVVIDPRRSETAELADIHLQVTPGRDAWLLTAMVALLVQSDGVKRAWLEEHARSYEGVLAQFADVPIDQYCEWSGVPRALVEKAVDRIAKAASVAVFEDLGVQMNHHSTLVSWLEKLLWVATGNFAKPGSQYIPTPLSALGAARAGDGRTTPVTGARVISGLIPCNAIADEILTDHPDRQRAMIVDAANPAHSLADSKRFREAMRALDFSVVIDVAMTETARQADYVLPTANQYEKAEATFFNFEFPNNYFHLRHPLFDAPEGVLTEAEIHARLLDALGETPEDELEQLRAALAQGRLQFAGTFMTLARTNPQIMKHVAIVLYRTLGETLPKGLEGGAALWLFAHKFARENAPSLARAGFEEQGPALGEALFDRIMDSPSGLTVSKGEWSENWERVQTADGRIDLSNPEMEAELAHLAAGPQLKDDAFPFVLSAGERRAYTANTIYRDPAWRRKDFAGALAVSVEDAARLQLTEGGLARISTQAGTADVVVTISERMMPGHISLPNGQGLDYPDEDGTLTLTGTPPNELTSTADCDPIAGTPWHKSVPAQLEKAG